MIFRAPAYRITVMAAALALASVASGVSRLGAQQTSKQSAQSGQKKTSRKSTLPASQQAVVQATTPVDNDSYNVTNSTTLRDAPSAGVIGELQKSANVEVLARDRGWSRVRVEGWVPDSLLTPADTTYRSNLSAADLRVNPAAARGKMVVWNVEFLALQTADPLRQGLADGEPYILARGPNSENALLYLVVPPSLMGTARALQPLARISVTARVRDGRSEPVGVPILDIETIRRIK